MDRTYDIVRVRLRGLEACRSARVADLVDANNVARHIKATTPRLMFTTVMDSRQCAHVAVHDASFDNMPNRKSQCGVVVLLADRRPLADHQGRYLVHPIMWASGRITRVVKSTLSAEAYSCTEALGSMNWARAVMAEILGLPHDGTCQSHRPTTFP